MDKELLYKDEVYKIIGAAIEVHKILGSGLLPARLRHSGGEAVCFFTAIKPFANLRALSG